MDPQTLFEFYKEAYKLKLVLRHCWLDGDRRESVADHTWMLTLLANIIIPNLSIKVGTLKLLKMIIYHDLAEIVTGDIPALQKMSMSKEDVEIAERKGLEELTKNLSSEVRKEILEYCEEFDKCESNEAMVANALDKVEAIMQHDLTDLDTWDEKEHSMNANYKDHMFNFDPFFRNLKDYVNDYTYYLIDRKGRLSLLTEEQKKYWEKRKTTFVPYE